MPDPFVNPCCSLDIKKWPHTLINEQNKEMHEKLWKSAQKNNKILEYGMKIICETLLSTLFALWTSKNDPTEAQGTPNASQKSPNGAQRLPKEPKWSPKWPQRAPKWSQNGAKSDPKRHKKVGPNIKKLSDVKESIFERRYHKKWGCEEPVLARNGKRA